MADSQQEGLLGIPIHPQAAELIKNQASDFTESLILQSKILAHQNRHDVVLRTHVEEALIILSARQQQQWRDHLALIIGSAFLGAFVQGFTDQLLAEAPNIPLIAAYVVLGFLGAFGIFYGLRRV